jgi:hypothetical protein
LRLTFVAPATIDALVPPVREVAASALIEPASRVPVRRIPRSVVGTRLVLLLLVARANGALDRIEQEQVGTFRKRKGRHP